MEMKNDESSFSQNKTIKKVSIIAQKVIKTIVNVFSVFREVLNNPEIKYLLLIDTDLETRPEHSVQNLRTATRLSMILRATVSQGNMC